MENSVIGNKHVTETTLEDLMIMMYHISEKPDLLNTLREKKYTVKDTDKTFRVINYWESVGLLNSERESNGWRKFSIIDIVYLNILSKLRKFNFSIEMLKTVKLDLEKYLGYCRPEDEYKLTILEYALYKVLTCANRGNVYFLIDEDAHLECISCRDRLYMKNHKELPDTYIYLNFNEFLDKLSIFKKFNVNIPIHNDKEYVLDGIGEEKLLKVLRTKNWKNINVTPHEDNILIECTQDLIEDVSSAPDYSDIVIKKQDGVVIKKEIKEKIKAK